MEKKMRPLLLGIMLSWLLIHTASAEAPDSSIVEHTNDVGTCSKNEWAKVATRIKKVAAGHAPELLVSLSRAYICDEREKAKEYLLRFAPEMIFNEDWSPGEDDGTDDEEDTAGDQSPSEKDNSSSRHEKNLVPSKDYLRPRGLAERDWDGDVYIEETSSAPREVTLHVYLDANYYIVFKATKTAWQILGIAGAGC
jgi:hypothetical protein